MSQTSEIIENSPVYQNASLGIYGHKVFTTGQTSSAAHEFLAITAIEDSVVSYDKADVQFQTYGDDSVTSLSITAGMVLVLGVIKNINVVSGKVLANLITRP
tara:strand:- start:136 stop:441 length:306 start_codon:yes stop_codon:yes gene_type:complete